MAARPRYSYYIAAGGLPVSGARNLLPPFDRQRNCDWAASVLAKRRLGGQRLAGAWACEKLLDDLSVCNSAPNNSHPFCCPTCPKIQPSGFVGA